MGRRERRRLTDEFKAEVVGLVRSSGKSIPEVGRDLDLNESAVTAWLQPGRDPEQYAERLDSGRA